MKKIGLAGILLMILVLTSCDKDERSYSDNFWVTLATVRQASSTSIFSLQLDNGLLVWPIENRVPDFMASSGQRVMINYTLLSDSVSGPQKREIRLNSIGDVMTKQVIRMTTANKDSIGNDPLDIDEIWIGGNYLNVSFFSNGEKIKQAINLVYNTTIAANADGKTHFELHQNNNGDASGNRNKAIISYDLRSFFQNGVSPVQIVIEVKNYTGSVTNYLFTYKYN